MNAPTRRRGLALWSMVAVSTLAHATSPCEGDACIDEASAELLASIDIGASRCAASDPAHADDYLAWRTRFLARNDEPPGFLARLQSSRFHAAAVRQVDAAIDEMAPARRALMCEQMLEDARRR